RAKLPNACSSWPAFWTCGWDKWGEDRKQNGSNWPGNGEIDFMEFMCVNSNNEPVSPSGKKNKDKEYEVHLHCGPKDNAANVMRDFPIDPGTIYDTKGQQLGAAWHTYGLIWTENQMQFTMDGVVRITVDTSDEALLAKAEKQLKNNGGVNNDLYKAYKTQLETKGNPFNDFEHYFLLNYAIGGAGTEWRFYSDEWPQHLLIDYIRVYQEDSNLNSGGTMNSTLFNYCANSYNTWYGKGLTKGAQMAQNWVNDPVYGGKKTAESDVVTPTYTTSTQTTQATQPTQATTTTTTANGGSTGGTTASGAVIDWDVNSNFWTEGSNIVSKDANGVTVTKASGKNLLTANENNLTGYDGLTFTVTPNSGNEKTTLEVQVGDDGSKTATFPIGSGTTSCTLSFADYGITPTSGMYIYIRATGGDASNLTISDIMGYTGSAGGSDVTPTTQGGSSSNVKGDIDNNGAANVSDVLQLKKIISGASQSTPATADVNGDGKISSVDVMELKKLLTVG
ncbi:MAG: dockerin type I domain-containing protein, partial [Acutalibacteraceae bacterium]|nr:dockerin type I domain-containing protein [Acutalibacteraceae bacterium]